MFQWFSTIFSLDAPGSRSASALPKPGLSNEIMMRTTMTLIMMMMTMMIIVMMVMDPRAFSCVFHFFLSSKWHWSKGFVGYPEEQLTN